MLKRQTVIFLVTYVGEPELTEDDKFLQLAIESKGATVAPVCWNDPAVDWRAADLVVVRSTWDYIYHIEAFKSWVGAVSAQARLINSCQLLLWNADKRYLLELQAKMVKIVPSLLADEQNHEHIFELALVQFDGRIVIKPTISCGSHLTKHFLVTGEPTRTRALAHLKLVLCHSSALIQPLIDEVFTLGEKSLIFFEGIYSHAAPKEPFKEGLTPTYPIAPIIPTQAEICFCEAALSTLPILPIYARLDILEHQGHLMLNEMELIEPELHFHLKMNSADELANILVKLVEPNS